MNEALHHIRKAIISALSGQISINGSNVPIYNRVPESASEPFVKVYSVSNSEVDQNRSSFNSVCITRVEVVTAFDGDAGGELQCNQIVDSVLNLLRKRSADYFDLSANNFKVYTSINEGVTYFEDDLSDKTYFRAIIELSNRVQKI